MIFGITGALILLYKSLPKRNRPAPPPRKKLKNYPYGKGSGEAGLHTLRWDQFELLIAEVHRRAGFFVELSAALGAEDGVDLTLRKDNETVLVQCKHWKTLRLSESDMREFYSLMSATGAPKGIIVTLGAFTREAREFAEGKGIDLLDRKALEQRMAAVAKPGENMCDVPGWVEEFANNSRIFDPECPVCRESMALRQNRADQSATWTCRNYPRCGGTREPRMDLVQLAAARRAQAASAVGR